MAELGHAHTLETQLNVFADFHPKLTDAHRRIPYVFLANIDPDLQLEVLSQMRKPRLVLSDTMNYWIARKPDKVLEVLRKVDVALLNEEEARALAGETHLSRAAERLLEAGAHAVIIKKGEHGALYHSRDERFITPAYPVVALTDPTGAGDSFAGGFVGPAGATRPLRRRGPAPGHGVRHGHGVAWRSRRSRPSGWWRPPRPRSSYGSASCTGSSTTTCSRCSEIWVAHKSCRSTRAFPLGCGCVLRCRLRSHPRGRNARKQVLRLTMTGSPLAIRAEAAIRRLRDVDGVSVRAEADELTEIHVVSSSQAFAEADRARRAGGAAHRPRHADRPPHRVGGAGAPDRVWLPPSRRRSVASPVSVPGARAPLTRAAVPAFDDEPEPDAPERPRPRTTASATRTST